jgi:hypothetical protein
LAKLWKRFTQLIEHSRRGMAGKPPLREATNAVGQQGYVLRVVRRRIVRQLIRSRLRREETNAAILVLSKNSVPIEQIVRQTGHSRKLLRIRGERHDVLGTRQSSQSNIRHGHGSTGNGRPIAETTLSFDAV